MQPTPSTHDWETASGLNYNERKGLRKESVMTEVKQGVMAEEIRVVEH
jgi:hypothetical protein